MSSQHALVSIIIVNYNGAELLKECLRSVFGQRYRPIEVIVVDNGSVDESVAIVQREFPEARVLPLGRNAGFAEANNVGMRQAQGEFIVLLNNDTVVDENWLPPLLDMLQNPKVAIAASKVLTDGVPREFYEMNGTINYLGYNIMRQFTDLSMIFYAGGTSLMFRRHEVDEPFINEYFLYHEDVHLSWRMRLKGKDVRMAQDSVVYHRGSQTTRRQASSLITFYQVRNRILNLFIFYETRTLLKLLPLLIGDGIALLARAAVSRSLSALGALQAYGWLVAHAGWIWDKRAREQSSRAVRDEPILELMSADLFDESRSPRVVTLTNRLARSYARLAGLPYHV